MFSKIKKIVRLHKLKESININIDLVKACKDFDKETILDCIHLGAYKPNVDVNKFIEANDLPTLKVLASLGVPLDYNHARANEYGPHIVGLDQIEWYKSKGLHKRAEEVRQEVLSLPPHHSQWLVVLQKAPIEVAIDHGFNEIVEFILEQTNGNTSTYLPEAKDKLDNYLLKKANLNKKSIKPTIL